MRTNCSNVYFDSVTTKIYHRPTWLSDVWCSSFRLYSPVNLHNDANGHCDCTKGHITWSERPEPRQQDALELRVSARRGHAEPFSGGAMTFFGHLQRGSSHISQTHSGRCGGSRPASLTRGDGEVRRDTVFAPTPLTASGGHFSGERSSCWPVRQAGWLAVRWAAGVRAAVQTVRRHAAAAAAATAAAAGGGVVSFLVPDWLRWEGRVHVHSARARHTQPVIIGATSRLRPVDDQEEVVEEDSGLEQGCKVFSQVLFHVILLCSVASLDWLPCLKVPYCAKFT